MKELILGGTRSGKSHLAEQRAKESGLTVIYIATARAEDEEMSRRIKTHQQHRDPTWQLYEVPLTLADALTTHAKTDRCIIVDCLTLWITNLLCADQESIFVKERNQLIDVLPNLPGHIILVSNETGMGIVPLGEITRRYCDEAAFLHQQLAAICDKVTLTIAGLPTTLKEP